MNSQAKSSPAGLGRLSGYLRRLWSDALPLSQVFWTDMLVIGTAVNLAAMLLALALFVSGVPVALGVLVHFSPIPYNILVFLAVWRSAAREGSDWSFVAQAVAAVWLVAATIL